jgi:hypothetical protein
MASIARFGNPVDKTSARLEYQSQMTTDDDQARADDYEVEPPGDVTSAEDTEQNPGDNGEETLDDYYAELEKAMSDDDVQEEDSAQDEDDADAADEDAEEQDQEEESEDEESEDDDESDNSDEEDEAPAPKSRRFRFKTDEDQAVAAIAKAKGVSLVEAAKIYAAENPDAASKDDAREQEEESAPSMSYAEARAKLKDLRKQRSDALRNVELEEAADLDEQIDALVDEIEDIRAAEYERDSQEERAFIEKVEASKSKAVKYYPDVTDAKSELVLEMQRIDQGFKELGDPRFHDPDKPFKLAQLAAANLGMLPVNLSRRPAKSGTKAKSSRRPVHQPASGKARSASAAAPTSKVDEQIDGITSLDDYEEFVGNG